MQHNLKFGFAAMVVVFGGGSFYLGAAETPAFAQATAGGSTGQPATTGTTTGGATAQPQGRGDRARPGAGGTDVRGGQGRPGVLTTPDPVPLANTELSAGECRAAGGAVQEDMNCPGTRSSCALLAVVLTGSGTVLEPRRLCINQ